MGKSKNLHNEQKNVYQSENNLYKFLKKDEIEIIENISKYFSNKIQIDLSKFIKKNIKYFSYSIKIESFLNKNKKDLKNVSFLNAIEIIPFKSQFFLTFSSNFLSIFIDLLFGGRVDSIEKSDKQNKFTLTEKLINKKITNSIMNCFFSSLKKFYSLDIQCINMKMFLDFKKTFFNYHEIFLVNRFKFYVNNIEAYFSLLIPLSIIKTINEENLISSIKRQNKNKIYKNIYTEKNIINEISFKNINHLELDIKFKINNIFVPYEKFYSLSIGDVLSINNPDTITGFLEDEPIFFGKYKRFNKQCIFFIEKFIKNSEFKKDKEYLDE